MPYLDPFVLARISNLNLRAKTVVEGVTSGLHRSSYRGHSLEFSEHREYSFGDELKTIDWKVYGRTDRFFVKQFEEETNLRLYILLDASGSMAFKGEKSPFSKYDYGATLAASLSYLILKQRDSVGLAVFNDFIFKFVPPRNSFSHLNIILENLEAVRPIGQTTISKSLETIIHSCKKRSLVILISDLLDEPDLTLKALRLLKSKKHEVRVIHLLDQSEKNFPYSGVIQFNSMENDDHLTFDAKHFQNDYQDLVNRFIENYRLSLSQTDINYFFWDTLQPLDKVLRSLLSV